MARNTLMRSATFLQKLSNLSNPRRDDLTINKEPARELEKPVFMLSRNRQLAFSAANIWNIVCQSQTIRSAVRAATQILRQHDIPEAKASAEYLAISSFTNVRNRLDARTLLQKPPRPELDSFVSLCRERHSFRKPIQYLVGDWDFHDITLLVRPPVLIPRPETEELVEYLLNDVKQDNARILDVGCGSGAILLAVLSARPNWRGVGVDIASESISLTLDNAKLLGKLDRVDTHIGDIRQVLGGQRYHAIVSNPPYIPTEDMNGLQPEVKRHEDFRALCGGNDGLDVVREILKYAPSLLEPGGSVWLEVDESHPGVLGQMNIGGLAFVNSFDDLYGRPRFCHFRAVQQK